MSENWRSIPGFEGFYEVSNLGRVRSLPRWVRSKGSNRKIQTRIRVPSLSPNGYQIINLSKSGTITYHSVHKLVLEAFVGFRPRKMECRHLNGDKTDNQLDNLAWGTKLENASDSIKHGVIRRGSIHKGSKLTEIEVWKIRDLLEEGELTQKQIGALFKISQSQVHRIKSRRQWAWLTTRRKT